MHDIVLIVAGALFAGVLFNQWHLMKRLKAHRQVLNYAGGALKVLERDFNAGRSQVGELSMALGQHRMRIDALETAANIRTEVPSYGIPMSVSSSSIDEMGAPTIEAATTLWKRLLDEMDE